MAASASPQAPRAVVYRDGSGSTALSLERILGSTVKKLYPRLALFEMLARFKDGHARRDRSGDDICEARRDFLDSFAYLCDIEKGGATVTAAALQMHTNLLWLAANEGVRKGVKRYTKKILQKLERVELGTREAVQDEIFRLAMEKCASRIEYYKGETQKYARNCRVHFGREVRTVIVSFLDAFLEQLAEPPPNLEPDNLVDICYAARGAIVAAIRKRSKDAEDDFSRLAHFVGRLGATRSSVETVVSAMFKVPALRQISEIRTVKASESRRIMLDQESMSPYEIVRAICKDSASQNPIQIQSALHAVVDLDNPLNSRIRAGLASRKTIMTRVHAELQIADRFSRDQFRFLDDDKYIGCSKPACYFCYTWLSMHKHKYSLPATHHKIIPGCRGPDNDINEAGATILKEMYTKVCGKLDQDILDFLLSSQHGDAHLRRQYMSTEGSSRAPSRI